MQPILKKAIPLGLVLFMVVGLVLTQPAQAAATLTLSPSSGTAIVNTPFQFTVANGNASATYDIYLDGVTTSTTTTVSSSGTGSFSYTFTATGTHVLSLRMQTTHTSVGQSSLNVIDIVADMMPWITLALVFIVLFSVIKIVQKNIKF